MKKKKSVRYYRSPDEKFLNELGSLNSSHFSPGDLFGSLAPAGCLILPLLFAAAAPGGIWMLPEDSQNCAGPFGGNQTVGSAGIGSRFSR